MSRETAPTKEHPDHAEHEPADLPMPLAGPGQPLHQNRKISWPHPSRAVKLYAALWAAGLLTATVPPALLASPSPSSGATTSALVIALVCTLLGSLLMVLAAYLLYRKTGSIGAAIIAFVPSFVLTTFGILLLTVNTLSGTSAAA